MLTDAPEVEQHLQFRLVLHSVQARCCNDATEVARAQGGGCCRKSDGGTGELCVATLNSLSGWCAQSPPPAHKRVITVPPAAPPAPQLQPINYTKPLVLKDSAATSRPRASSTSATQHLDLPNPSPQTPSRSNWVIERTSRAQAAAKVLLRRGRESHYYKTLKKKRSMTVLLTVCCIIAVCNYPHHCLQLCQHWL